MIGQGCPNRTLQKSGPCVGHGRHRWQRIFALVMWITCAQVLCEGLVAQEPDLRLRIEWGGGTARRWHTRLTVDRGLLTESESLGLEPDVPGSVHLVDGELRVTPRTPRTYDGVDLRVTAPLDAILTVEMIPLDAPSEPFRKEIVLSSTLSSFQTFSVDGRGNSLLVRRCPGDQLRVEFDRENLVMAPGEQLPLTIVPHWAGLSADAQFDCNVALMRVQSNEEVWSTQQRVETNANGVLEPIGPLSIVMPDVEGVYDIFLSIVPIRRFTNRFVRLKPVVERKIQLVVIGERLNGQSEDDWYIERVIDPAYPRWWDRIKQLPQLNWITGFGSAPFGNEKSTTISYAGQDLIELDVDGWQAYPLPINNVGAPYLFEIEYPSNIPQTLGISVVEPNATGSVVPLGRDSGVDVQEPIAGAERPPELLRHRFVVWPKTSSPLLLLTNQRQTHPAVFGKIRLLSGPVSLPRAAPVRTSVSAPRMIATFFDRPLFPEVFGAPEELDDWSKQTCDNWQTFFAGGRRLTEYLSYAGYNTASVSVFSDGATIYPSKLLQPTARYDRGVFFISGQDPVRKDVLEMLLRLFDREGLRLVAALRFSTPLPEVESELRKGDATGIELMNDHGVTWIQENGIQRGKAAYYNPLDPRVQTAMVHVVAELAERYGHHPSFAGVTIQFGPDTFAQLPGETWCLDDETVARFERATSIKMPGEGANRFMDRGDFLRSPEHGQVKQRWMRWRSEQLASLYSRMAQQLDQTTGNSRLYLAMADCLRGPEMYAEMHPTLPRRTREDVAFALRRIGIDTGLYKNQSNVVLLRPQNIVPAASTATAPLSIDLRRAPQMDRAFSNTNNQGVQFSHVPKSRGLPSFEQKSPFGRDKTQIWMVPHVSPSGVDNRRRFVQQLASRDLSTIFDGGWMPLLGQEDAIRELFEVYGNLPEAKFEDVLPASEETPVHGVVIRHRRVGEQTIVYLVNDSPWRAVVNMSLDSLSQCSVTSLSARQLAQPVRNEEGEVRWKIELQPYDLVGASLDHPQARIIDWKVSIPEDVSEQLRGQLAEIEARMNGLQNPPPLNVITNAEFEITGKQDEIPGWKMARADEISIDIDSQQKHAGRNSLRLSVTAENRVAWVRSEQFPRPDTGRLAVFVWVKTDDPQQRPPFRLAVDGVLNGRPYYSHTEVKLQTSEWQQFIFNVDDLPPHGLSDLKVGFDLMGPGNVWIDDVQVFDRWFKKNEQEELIKDKAFAGFLMSENKFVKCHRYLESYWAKFLLEHVPAAPRIVKTPAPQKPPPPREAKTPGMMDRMRWLNRIFRF